MSGDYHSLVFCENKLSALWREMGGEPCRLNNPKTEDFEKWLAEKEHSDRIGSIMERRVVENYVRVMVFF